MSDEKKGKPTGRPTKYCPELQQKADEYLNMPLFETYSKEIVVKDQIQVVNLERPSGIPNVCGLALHLDVHRDTIYQWCKDHKIFSDTFEKLKQKQEDFLLYHGLTKGYDSGYAKFASVNMTSMRDKQETVNTNKEIKIEIDSDDQQA